MQISNLPATKLAIPFASSAGGSYTRAIPQASQIGITNGAASLTDGFPPLNFLPVGAGGVPPFGQDMNGILNEITAWTKWQNAGGLVPYDATFSTAIGGYPQGALLTSTSAGVVWLNLVDNNTANPDTGGANWLSLGSVSGSQSYNAAGVSTFTVPSGVYKLRIRLWGAGGGSGGTFASGSASQGGGGGGYAEGLVSVTPAQAITVTVGAGGAAGTATPTAGGNGGTSSFGASMSATGGAGGLGANGVILNATVAAAGVGTGGSIMNLGGCTSDAAYLVSGTNFITVGKGGASFGGLSPHVGVAAGASANGVAGLFPGGGATGSGNQAPGAAGADGQILIQWGIAT